LESPLNVRRAVATALAAYAGPHVSDTIAGEAGLNAYDIAKLMGHANISTSQRYVRNLPVGAGEAVMLKNQRRHNTVTNDDSGTLMVAVNS